MATMIKMPDGKQLDYDNEIKWLTDTVKGTGQAGDIAWADSEIAKLTAIKDQQVIETSPVYQDVNPEIPTAPVVKPFEGSYTDSIKSQLSEVMNYDDFEYNPDTDQLYQAYLGQMKSLGQEAFTNNLVAISSATGGRPNSWSQTVATQQQNKFLSEASSNMSKFEEASYKKWMDKYNMSVEQLEMLIKMEDRDYAMYWDGVEQQYKEFEANMSVYDADIQAIEREWARAWDRTNTLGYVSNEDAALLGVQPGTPSKDIMLIEANFKDYVKRVDEDIRAAYAKGKQAYELELEFMKNASTFSGAIKAEERGYNVTDKDVSEASDYIQKKMDFVTSDAYLLMTPEAKFNYFSETLSYIEDYMRIRGFSEQAFARAELMYSKIKSTIHYQNDYQKYVDGTISINEEMTYRKTGINDKMSNAMTPTMKVIYGGTLEQQDWTPKTPYNLITPPVKDKEEPSKPKPPVRKDSTEQITEFTPGKTDYYRE